MKHLTGSGKSGRIGTWWIVVAAAVIVLAATGQTAKACVTCTPGGGCESCSIRAAALYGDERPPQPGCTGTCSAGSPGADVRPIMHLAFEHRTIPQPADSKTLFQVIVNWDERSDASSSNQAENVFSRCFQVELTDEQMDTNQSTKKHTVVYADRGPGNGMPVSLDGAILYYKPISVKKEGVEQNDTKILENNDVRIAITSNGQIILRDKAAWGVAGATLDSHAGAGWELRDDGKMYLWHDDVVIYGDGVRASPISTMKVGAETHYYKYDRDYRMIRCIVMRGDKVRGITYKRYTESGGVLHRIRTTEVTFDSASNGGLAGPQVKTWIHGYWSTGSDNVRGRLRYVVNPEGVVRHSGSSASGGVHTNNIPTTEDPDDSFPGMDDGPYLSCGLDSASDDALIGFAASVYNDYDAAGNVTDMTKGCGSCGSGHYTYSYGPCSGFPTTEDQDFNQAVRYIRQTTPTGLRVVEFQNAQGFLLFRVEQETTVAGTRRWTTHYKYDKDKNGRLKETRMPSACEAAGYNHTEGSGSDAGWPTAVAPSESGTEGLVYLKGFIDEEGPDKFPEYTWQAVRHGTNSGGTTLYTSVTAYFKFTESLRRDLVKATYEFPGAVTANPLTIGMRAMDELLENTNYTGLIARTGYAYTFYTPSPVIRTETITRQAVSPGNHGSGSGGIVRRYYHRDGERGVRYWNQWTQHEDGTCTRTEQNDYGQTSYTIEDADTAALPTDLNWSARSGGLNLTTNYTYDDAGRIYKVIANGIPSQTAYLSCRQTGADDIIMTTRLVTLHAPFDGVNYALLPLQISVTDVGGHTTVAATGKPTSATDGDLCDDWASGAPGDGVDPSGNVNENMTAFQGTVYSRTVSTYDANGNPLATIRLTNAAAFTAPQYKTAYLYGTSGEAFGQLVATTSETGGITWSDYDQHGRVIATWQGSALGDPPAAGAPGGDMVLVAETFYDQATPGAGASGVGDGNVTMTKAYYGPGANDAHTTTYTPDWRNRITETAGSDGVATVRTFDNMGREKTAMTYIGGTGGTLQASTATSYDELGQVCQTRRYEAGGSAALATDYWYDDAGRLLKTANAAGLFQKTKYDALGRAVAQYLCYNSNDILVATIACLGVMAVSASMAPMRHWPSFVFIPEEDTSLYRKGTTWGPWMQATSCPLGLSGSERWGTARVRCGHIVRDREVMTFWEVDGQRKLICNISSSPRVDVYLWAGGVTAGMGIVWVLLWYNVATRLGKDRAPTTDGREDALVRTRANACLVVLHFASIMVCLLGIRILWLEVPSGEGWWFTRTHTGAMWLASIMANAAAGYLVLTRKRQSISLTALSILGLLTPVAPALARLQGVGIVHL